jgi:CubicO group peptidase (beta-lactamase class C family)
VFADSVTLGQLKPAFPVIEKIYADLAERNHLPSVTYGVIVQDKLVFYGSTGLANLETRQEANAQTVYRIASMSKSFTAMAILKLRDDGNLHLDDAVAKHIPEFRSVAPLTTDAPSLTIRHLMTMAAGFPEDNPWGDQQLQASEADLIRMVKEGISFSNVPGIAYEYSNLGFALLGKVISNITGKPYQHYITENILKPLGMNHTYYEYADVPSDQLALGYRWEEEKWKPEPLLHDGVYGAMGGMLCSLEDFARYVSFHLQAWPPRSGEDVEPVKRSSIREMHQPWRFNDLFADAKDRAGNGCAMASGYGYGLAWRKDCSGRVRISHSGGLPGFGSEWRIYPEYGVGVVAFSNRTYGGPGAANAIALDTLIHIAGLKPRVYPNVPLLEQTKSNLMEVLPDWNVPEDSDLFAMNFFLDQSPALRRKETQALFTEMGSIQSVSQVQPENQLRGTFVITGEKRSVEVFFTLSPEAKPKVQQLDLRWVE